MCAFMSDSPVWFHWSMCLFLCQYHAVFVTVALWYNSRLGMVIPLSVLFLFRIVVAILDSFVFPYEAEDCLSCEEFLWGIMLDFDADCIKSAHCFYRDDHFYYVSPTDQWAWESCPSQDSVIHSYTRYFILFGAIVKGGLSLIFFPICLSFVYRRSTDFCKLILYSAPLLKCLSAVGVLWNF